MPAVVELAAAADSKEHHKELNGSLLKHLRSEQAAVRLAVVKCQQALTERLGEEWLASLPEMLPYISELQDDDDEVVERENRRWIVGIEQALGGAWTRCCSSWNYVFIKGIYLGIMWIVGKWENKVGVS